MTTEQEMRSHIIHSQVAMAAMWKSAREGYELRDRLEHELRATKLALTRSRLLLLASAMVLAGAMLVEASRYL
jgi:hypothetical protein